MLPFLGKQPRCTVALESCAGAHNWRREIQALGHEVKLIPPIYVKPFVKRQKNDANDAAAIVEAASRASMRTVAVKSREMQAKATLFRCRALLIRQRTQITNSIRGLLLEFGLTAPSPSLTTSIFRPYKAIIFQLVIEGRRILVAHHFGISGDYRKLSSGCDGGVGCDDGPGGGADAFG